MISAQRDEAPAVFTRIDVVHDIEGPDVDVAAVRRAIELSATRYCAVGSTLASGDTEVHHRFVIRDATGSEPVVGEVVILGPDGIVELAGVAAAVV